jgi:hypothetical protein
MPILGIEQIVDQQVFEMQDADEGITASVGHEDTSGHATQSIGITTRTG